MDFKAMVVDSIERLAASGAIEKHIDEQVSKTVQDIVHSELKSYSDFGKVLGEAVKKALSVQTMHMDLPEYNNLICKIVAKQVDMALGAVIEQQVSANLKKILNAPPAEITVQQLVDQLKEKVTESHGCHCDPIYLAIQIEESESSDGYWRLYLHDEAKNSLHKYSYRYQLAMDPQGCVYSLSVGGVKMEERLFVGPHYGFDRLLFAIYVGKTKVLKPVSVDEIDTHVGEYV